MKKSSVLVLLVCFSMVLNANVPVTKCLWAHTGNGYGKRIVDANDAIYIMGGFIGKNILVDTFQLQNHDTSGATEDGMVIKYSKDGQVNWVLSFGGVNDDYWSDIQIDNDGNLYLSCSSPGPNFNIGDTSFLINNDCDIILAKFNSNGQFLNAKCIRGIGWNTSQTLNIDKKDGSIYISGNFSREITIDTITLKGNGSDDVFISKFDKAWNVVWAKCFIGKGPEYPLDFKLDNLGNIIMTGMFESDTLGIGAVSISNPHLDYDIFIVKLNEFGQPIWAKSVGDFGNEQGYNIGVDQFGNIFVSGTFGSPQIAFDSIVIRNHLPFDTQFKPVDFFLAKYDSTGNILWVKQGTGEGWDHNFSSITNANGETFMVISFTSPSLVINNTVIARSGSLFESDILTVKFSNTGKLVWVKQMGGIGHDELYDIALGLNRDVYILGKTASTFTVDSIKIISDVEGSLFLAQLDDMITSDIHEVIWEGKILPIPGKGIITLISPNLINQISVTNILGQVVYTDYPLTNETQILLPVSGIYFISIVSDQRVFVQKVIIE